MPHPFQIEEWRLLEDLKSQIVHRAPPQQLARHDSFPGASHNGDLLEPDLRQVFSLMGSGISWNMGESDLDDCEEHLARLCASLERILPPVRNGHHTTQYPRLEGLTQFLKGKPDDFYVYLACGRSLHHLFDPPVDVSHLNDCLKHVGDVLKLLMRLQESSKPQERDIEPPRAPPKRYAWKKSRVRNRANLVLDCIFDHIRCDTQHDIMLKLLQDPDESAQLPDLQLLLSPCKGADLWHDLLCDSAESYTGRGKLDHIHDMCASMDDCDGQGHLLSLILHGSHLFSTRRGDGSSAREAAQLRRPLNELIRDGAFVRHGEGAPVPGGSFAKYSPRDKRELALKLAFFLLDFFDSGITSDRIHMPVGPRPGRQRTHAAPFLSFGSSPLSEADQESYWNFDIGHPALVSFSKLLLELEWGRPIDLDISQDPYQNRETWSQLMMMLHDSEVDIDDCLYTDAIDGCLSSARPIAKALRKCGLEDRTRASSKVRQLLYDKVVSKLEAGLEKSIPRRRGSKRERSESPPPLSDSLKGPMPKITTTRMAHRHKDAGHSRGSSLPHSLSGLHDGTNGSRQSRSPLSHVSYPRPAGRDDFEVAIMCALDTEYNAVHRLLDVSWPDNVYGKEDADENVYTTGRMGSTNVVVVLMGMGKVPAACAATSLRFSYKNVRLALLVGICGAVPHDPKSDREILRGDVIVGKTIVQHDFGRLTEDGLITKTTVEDSLGRPNPKMRNLLSAIGTDEYMAHLRGRTAHFLADIQAAVACTDDCNKYHHPGHRQDTSLDDMARRPQSSISNGRSPADDGNPSPPSSSSSSSSPPYDQDGRTAPGPTRGRRQLGPTVHVGVYASGDSVVRSADARDRIAQKTNAIGFEMESAGIWDKLPCIVVKGVCDYADPEKDRIWQNFASATAASATKAIIERYHER